MQAAVSSSWLIGSFSSFFLFCNGATQTGRVLAYRSRQSQDSVGAEAVKAAKEEGGAIKGLAENPQAAVKKAERV